MQERPWQSLGLPVKVKFLSMSSSCFSHCWRPYEPLPFRHHPLSPEASSPKGGGYQLPPSSWVWGLCLPCLQPSSDFSVTTGR